MKKSLSLGDGIAQIAKEGLAKASTTPVTNLAAEWRHRASYLKAQAHLTQKQHIEAERMAGHTYHSGFLCMEARELLAQANTLELCAMELEARR